ncbi:MAG: ATPase [Betaproteobacteria bacterium]|nr:ATPase [Betaproteobacteria bacterium]
MNASMAPPLDGPNPSGSASAEREAAEGRCPGCGALPGAGRWGWGGGEPEAHAERCPVCQRIFDHFPPGNLLLTGPKFHARRAEILRAVLRYSRAENWRYPTRHVLASEVHGEDVLVRTNDARLVRHIGDALVRRLGGELGYDYGHDGKLLTIRWRL